MRGNDNQNRVLNVCFLACLGYCLLSCRSGVHHQVHPDCDQSIDKVLVQWKSDASGCHHFRNMTNTKELIKCYYLESVDCKQLQSVLGKADLQTESDQNLHYRYFFNSLCSGGKLVDSADYCWVEFTVPKRPGKNVSIEFVCF